MSTAAFSSATSSLISHASGSAHPTVTSKSAHPSSSSTSASSNADKPLRQFRTKAYPKEIWWTLICFLVLISVFQFGSFLHSKYARRGSPPRAADLEKPGSPSTSRRFSLRRVPLALVNVYRVVAFRWTIEFGRSYTLNFAEVILTAMYMATLFTWALINTTDTKGLKFDTGYWENRAGALAASQFPLITALGTKNNIISLITGVSYEKLSYMHRMVARVVFVLLWVHAGAKIRNGIYPDIRDEKFLQAGLTAAVAFSLLCLISIRPIRAGAYELFFYTHFATVLILLLGTFYHVKRFEFHPYIVSCFIIWGLDRLIRFVRVLVFNFSYFGFKAGSGTLSATTELLSEGLVRLRLPRPPHFHWKAGQTAYLILPSVSTLPFEAHPFTIASFDSSSTTHAVWDEKGDRSYWTELVFLINAREGFTKRLRQQATVGGTVKVFVDGPYGPANDLRPFDTCVLIAGGAGVSYTLPVLLNIIENVRDGSSGCRKVVFVWAIRDARHVYWISDALNRAVQIAPSNLEISIRIYCTGANLRCLTSQDDSTRSGANTINSDEGRENKDDPFFSLPTVDVFEGRPDIHRLLHEEVDGATGRMSVRVCGSQSIANAVRHALRFPISGPSNVLRGGPSVTLHVESFGYA